MKQKILCVIPARLDSQRLERKIFSDLGGKTLLQRVWDRAISCKQFDQVLFAIDAEETAQVIESFGGNYQMTSPSCRSGTERLIELATSGDFFADIWVNWQADEPFITSSMIDQLLSQTDQIELSRDIWTLKAALSCEEDLANPNIVKVVTNCQGDALYFSRAPIPYRRGEKSCDVFQHLGIYAYRAEALQKMKNLPTSPLEKVEKLEQLTFLYHQFKMGVIETKGAMVGIDTHKDLLEARKQFI